MKKEVLEKLNQHRVEFIQDATDIYLEDLHRNNEEYQKASEEYQSLYEKIIEMLPQEGKQLLNELDTVALHCAIFEYRHLYEKGLEDGKVISL